MSQPQTAKKRGTTDPETSAITKIGKLVAELEEPARGRVLQYIHSRYCPQANPPAGQ